MKMKSKLLKQLNKMKEIALYEPFYLYYYIDFKNVDSIKQLLTDRGYNFKEKDEGDQHKISVSVTADSCHAVKVIFDNH